MELVRYFVSNIVNGGFSFGEIFAFFGSLVDSVRTNAELVTLWNNITHLFGSLSLVMPLILIVLSLLEVFFGKKLLGVTRFIVFFISGYCIGVNFVAPVINEVLVLPNYISGFVIALVASVFCRYLYFAFLFITVGYGTYLALISYIFSDKFFISLVIAIAAVALVFSFRKYVEMGMSSLFGGYLVSLVIRFSYYDYVASLGTVGIIIELIIVLALGGFGTYYQIKHRTKF